MATDRPGNRAPIAPDTGLTVFYCDTYVDTSESFDTLTKAAVVADLIRDEPGVVLRAPEPATLDELLAVHDSDYLDALRTGEPVDLAGSNGLQWDERLFDAACASTGGIRDAALTALTDGVAGSLSSGLHHARRSGGQGYCTLNGLVVAARAALDTGVGRVLILDFDAHCGGGTAELIDGLDGVEQVDVSVSSFDRYPSRPDARLTVCGAIEYLKTIRTELDAIIDPAAIGLVLYNAGMDPHEHAGGVTGITTDTLRTRETMVFEWARNLGVPIAFALAGGYTSRNLDLSGVAELHRLTVVAATDVAARTEFR